MRRFLSFVVVLLVGSALLPAQSQFGNQKVSAGSTCPPVGTPLGGEGSLYTCTGSGVLYTWTGSAWVAIAGGSGTPGSPTTSLQYNNSGAFGGISQMLWDGSTLARTQTKTGGPFTGTVFAFFDNALTFNPSAANQNGYGTRTVLSVGASENVYTVAGVYSEIQYTAAKDVVSELDGFNTYVNFNTSNTAEKVVGVSAAVHSSGTVTDLWGMASFNNVNTGTVTAFTEGFHAGPFRGAGTSNAEAAFYAEDYSDSSATNKYYVWLDSRGVYRIREDSTFDSVGQAIATLYNPLFTKYSAGTPNFERCIPGCQWETNVAFIGNEAGGTGVLRDVKFMGQDIKPSPTGFFYLHNAVVTSAPASGDCDAASETNRVVYDSTNDNLYVCSGISGWRKIATAAP